MIGYLSIDGALLPIVSVQVSPEGFRLSARGFTDRSLTGAAKVMTVDGDVALVGTDIVSLTLPDGTEPGEVVGVDITYNLNVAAMVVPDGTVPAR